MAGTVIAATRSRNGYIQLDWTALDREFDAIGVKGLRKRAARLGVSTTVLHRARHGGPCNADLILGVRTQFPTIAYKRFFAEVAKTDEAAA